MYLKSLHATETVIKFQQLGAIWLPNNLKPLW